MLVRKSFNALEDGMIESIVVFIFLIRLLKSLVKVLAKEYSLSTHGRKCRENSWVLGLFEYSDAEMGSSAFSRSRFAPAPAATSKPAPLQLLSEKKWKVCSFEWGDMHRLAISNHF